MGLEKYRPKKSGKFWSQGDEFICPDCNSKCGKENSQLINQGRWIARWCEKCSYYGIGAAARPLDYVNLDVISCRCSGYPC